jgi:hypothetical protein
MHFFRVLIRWLIGTSKFVLISPLSSPFAHSVQQDGSMDRVAVTFWTAEMYIPSYSTFSINNLA